MGRRILGIVLAVLLAAVGTGLLVLYVKGAERRALAGVELADVLVVQEAVEKGTAAEDLGDRVGVEPVARKLVAEGAVADVEELEGRVAAVDLVPGEQVVSDRFAEPAAFQAGGVDVPEGLQVVTVALSADRTVGGHISPGDTVGVLASFDREAGSQPITHLMLHRILVTNVQGDPSGQPSTPEEEGNELAPAGNVLISLAVEAGQAERIVFAAEHGTLWLTSQPEDVDTDGTRVRNVEEIFQ